MGRKGTITKKARSLVKLKIYKKIWFSLWFTEKTLESSGTACGCGAPYTALTDLGQQYFEREKVHFGGKQAIS